MRSEVPFYQRTLDSFSDEIITSVRQSSDNGLWYASLALAPGMIRMLYPNYSTCRNTREEAVRDCAQRIRESAAQRPDYHGRLLAPDGYYFCFKLARHWVEKEQASR
jgi:hypothetical protein